MSPLYNSSNELGVYKTAISWRGGNAASATTANTYTLLPNSIAAAASNNSPISSCYLDPADYNVGPKTTYYRVVAQCLTNSVAPTVNFTFGLYPITAVAGGASANTCTLGTVQAGSTVAFTAPALSTQNTGNSGDFAAPAAGYYCLACVVSGTAAVSSSEELLASLQVRQV